MRGGRRVDLRPQARKSLAHRLVAERVGGHDQRVLAVVAVVARPEPDRPETELLVQPPSRQVGQADLERRLVRTALRGKVEEREEQPLADALTTPSGWTANVMMWPSSTISHMPPNAATSSPTRATRYVASRFVSSSFR